MVAVLLFPTETEARPLRACRPDLDIRICGVGAAQTARFMQRMLAEERPEAVVLCGIAGAYEGSLRTGDTVAVVRERMAGVPTMFAEEYAATVRFGGLTEVAANTVANVGAPADGAQVENMEGAVVFAVCESAGVRCGEIRAVSNRVDDARENWDIPAALENLTKVLTEMF